jgi:serine/threonine protein kinase
LVNDNVKRRIVDQASRDHYALKFLQNGLSPEMYRHGAAQLVVEMILLSSLRHPNIIKIWGVSREGPLGFKTGRGYFILIDRLQNTLDDEMKIWRQQNLSEKSALKSSMIQRLQVAADISSALAYLHSRRILYRSLDPRNLAFNDEGKIVLFDFGLARELDDTKLSEDGRSYRLSGNKGNPFYM